MKYFDNSYLLGLTGSQIKKDRAFRLCLIRIMTSGFLPEGDSGNRVFLVFSEVLRKAVCE